MFVQDRSVDRQPLALFGLDLVGDRDVGVQIRVACAGVAMQERGGDQATGLDLPRAAGSLAAEDRMGLEEGQRVEYGGVVRHLDLPRDLGRCDRPQGRNRLRGAERQVESGDRALLERVPECGPADWVTAVAEEVLHLLDGDVVAVLEAVESAEPGADPPAGRFALGGVVVRQRSPAELGRVRGRDLASQVLIARPGGELLQRHRHIPQGRNDGASGHPGSSVKEVCLGEGGVEEGRGEEARARRWAGGGGEGERGELGWPLEDIPRP